MIKRFLLLFMLFVSFFSQKALAISIVLDGTQKLISGQECQTATYRFGTQSSYQGQPIDLILEVTAEDNEYNADKCVDIVDNVIGFRLRDKDFSNNYAYMDIKVTVVKKGTLTPLNVDAITVTNFDLDSNPYYTGTDDVYYKNPTKVYLSEFTNVTESRGSFFNNYTTKLKGQSSGNCDDSATLLQKECRGGVSFNNTSSFYARVQNDNAYGTYNSRYEAYRLIQFSFELKDLTPLMSDIELPCGISNYSTSNNSWIEGTTHTRYIDNMDISKTFKIENTQSIKLTINGETEKNFDWVYIYDENNNQVYVGSGIFNNTPITVTGSKVTVRVTSDRSVTKSGISVKIEGVGCEEEPIISIVNPVEITEGDSGDKDLIFTINLDTPAPSNGVTVQVDPHNITALEGEDYSRVISSINFNQGELQKTIIYKIHGDTKVEDNETFSIELHNPQNAKLDENKSSAIGTIINDDKEIFISIAGDVNITEGDSGTQPLDFKILLSDPAPIGGVTVQVQPHNITALEGEDYSRNISSIYFAQGEKEKTISFSIKGDTKVEDNETFSIEIDNPQHAKIDENHKIAIGTIINDDGSKPVGCLQTAWMFQNKPTDISALNLANGQMSLVKNNITNDNINSLGFNKKDGYFWGYNHTKQDGTITRIGMNNHGNWISEDFKVSGLNRFDSYVGDIDNNGHLYLKGGGSSKRVVVIDLDPNSSNYLKKIKDFNLNFNLNTADWAFNPKDNMLYAVNNGGRNKQKYLYKIDPSNGHKLSKQNTMLTGGRGFGASFFDANGFYYIYDNRSGNIYRIDVAHSAKAILFSHANIVSKNDGAMCTDAQFKFDFGDLPDRYPTRLESNGARHSLPTYGEPTVYMGSGVSSENNGKPSNSANLDSKDDGVKLNNSSLQGKSIDAGTTTTLTISTHGRGYLNAWIDWNSDGDFNDANEQIAHNIDGSSGLITLNITAPNSATDRETYARFRYSYQQNLTPTGSAIDGEVEDYEINIHGNLEPFTCTQKLYLSNRTRLGTGSGDSGATWLHSFYTMTPAFTPIGDGFTSSDGGYNAIGYNPKDNFIYALYGNRLLKIDKNANIKDLGVVNGLPDEQLYAGTFDREGYYFVSGNGNEDNKIYKIDIENNTVTKVININLDGEDKSVKFWDMAIDTSDQYLYAMLVKDSGDDFTNDKFVKIDKNTGAMSIIGEEYNDINSYISLIYTDSNNKIVAIANGGGMYEINPLTGTAYWINNTPELSYYNDGGNCPNASFILPPHIPRLSIGDVSKAEGDSGETNFEFKVSIDADLPMAPMGMPVFFFYKVLDGDGNEVTPPHGVATQSDNDFQGGNGIGINMNIFSDKREATISVPVYGDTKVEPDEEFFVDIYFPQMFPQNFCLLGKSRGVGVILNDDIKFKIIRTNGDDSDDKLYTQITNRDFDYSIISNNDTIDDMTLKIELIDTNSNDILYRGYQYIQNSNRADIINENDLNITEATKDAHFRVSFLKDENGTIAHGNYANEESYNNMITQAGYTEMSQDDASDHFAIRPAGYIVEIRDIDENNNTITYRDSSYSEDNPLNLSAGYNYLIYAKAIGYDNNSSIALGYTTDNIDDINATLIFDDKLSCNDISNAQLHSYSFNNGELRNTITHENVGKYKLRIIDNSWSDIDKNSGDCIPNSSIISNNANEKSGCDISTDAIDKYHEISMKFYPYEFAIDAQVQNIPNSNKDFVYMNDLNDSLDMALDIKANILAQSKNHIPLTNFTYSCVANDVILSLNYNITTDRINNQPTYDKILTTKGSEVSFKRVVAYNDITPDIDNVEKSHLDKNITISADKFLNINEGNSSIEILYNINKNLSEPINPVEIKFNNLELNSTINIAKIKNKTAQANGIGNLNIDKKLYFSSVAPDIENYPDEYDRYCVTPITVLIYCENNTTWCNKMIENNGLNNLKTNLGWYTSLLHDSNTDGKVLGFTVNNLLSNVNPTANNLPNFNENKGRIVNLTTGYSGNTYPAEVQVDMDLSPWLKYHRDPARNGIPFWRNTFRDRNATWSGVGDTGNQIDIKTTTIPAKKISW